MTLGEIKKRVFKLIDEYSKDAMNYTGDEDYKVKVCAAIDLSQKQVASVRPIRKRKTYYIDSNAIAFATEFGKTYIHRNADVTFSANNALAYYFEVDNGCTVKIYAGDTETITIINNDGRGWKSYKGFIEASGVITIKFSGSFVYHLRNVCLYNVNYPYTTTTTSQNQVVKNTDQIPDYSCEYALPHDFVSLISITEDGHGANFKIEAGYITVPPSECEVVMLYNALPTTITDETPDATNLELDIDAQEAVIYGAIADVLKADNNNLYIPWENKFNTLLSNLPSRTVGGIKIERIVRNGV